MAASDQGDGHVRLQLGLPYDSPESVAAVDRTVLPLIERALELDPENSDAWTARGVLLRWTQRPGNDLFIAFNQGWIQEEDANRSLRFRVHDTKLSATRACCALKSSDATRLARSLSTAVLR